MKWLDLLRDTFTLLAVLFAAALAGLLVGAGNTNVNTFVQFLSSHPYLAVASIMTGVLALVFFLLTIAGDIMKIRQKSGHQQSIYALEGRL